MKRLLPIFFLFLFFGKDSFSQNTTLPKDTFDYYDMSLEQLLNMKAHGIPSELESLINQLISVASKKPLSTRESPSIVSLITEEEIHNSGARDLIDVLRLVPGIDFGMDVYGVVGIAMRGNWAHEGKVLVLLDGQEMNEVMYGNNEFGNHFDVDQIKKIEIIRGPGSAIYGGFAEYGVINIITKSGADLNGVSVTGTYGQMENAFARRNINVSAGTKVKDAEISLSAFTGQGNRSDQTYTDIYGHSYNMAGNSKLDPTNINLGIAYKGLSFRGIIDKYDMTVQDAYDAIKMQPYGQTFDSYFGELKYIYKVNDKLTITPRLNFKRQQPWASTTAFDSSDAYARRVDRYRANLTASYNVSRKINFVAGGELFNDYATDLLRNHLPDSILGGYFYTRDAHGKIIDSSKTVQYHNYAFFAQGLIKQRWVNIILGARYDYSNAYGSAFVPRVGLTKKIKKINFKLLYSNSFRAPSIENIDKFRNTDTASTTGIKPEKTTVVELELGYQLTRNSIITANIYDITTVNPIIYYVTASNEDAYHNYGKTGSRGVEVEYRIKEKWGYVNLNYSYYTTAGKNLNDSSYMVPGHPNVHLAFPANRVNLNSAYHFTKNLTASATMSFYDTRYGYTDTIGIHKFKPTVLLNIFVNYNNLLIKGLNLGIGVYDAANEKFEFIQAYNSGHAPLPGPSREFIVKLSYEVKYGAKNSK